MAKLSTFLNNMARGLLDRDLGGRFDLPIYATGARKLQNFHTNFKGNLIYRPGFKKVAKFQDCRFIPFIFTDEQNYLALFTDSKIKFLSYDSNNTLGFVQSAPSTDLEVSTFYTLAQTKTLDFAQNGDVIYLTDVAQEPRKLTRTGATSFNFGTFSRTNDPFTTSNWPRCVTFYQGRIWYGGLVSNPTRIVGSESGDYDDFTVGSPVTDASAITLNIAEVVEPFTRLFPGENSLLAFSNQGVVAINGGQVGASIAADSVEANITPVEGSAAISPVQKDGLIFYITSNNRRMRAFKYDLLVESFRAADLNITSYDVTRDGILDISHKRDRNDLMYARRGDGALTTLNYNEEEKIIAWSDYVLTDAEVVQQAVIKDNLGNPQLFVLTKRGSDYFIEVQADEVSFPIREDFDTGNESADTAAFLTMQAEKLREANYLDCAEYVDNLQSNSITYDPVAGTITANSSVFTSNDVGKHIVYKTATGYEYGRFEITGHTSGTVVDVDVLITPHANTYTDWYLTFSSVSGLVDKDGLEVSVVADGYYLGEFTVDTETIDLGRQVASCWIGFKYKGIYQSFNPGLIIQNSNTQVTPKKVSEFFVRAENSAGGQIGTSLYKLAPIQKITQGAKNYLPLPLINGTNEIIYADTARADKSIFLVQNDPLPFKLLAIFMNSEHGLDNS